MQFANRADGNREWNRQPHHCRAPNTLRTILSHPCQSSGLLLTTRDSPSTLRVILKGSVVVAITTSPRTGRRLVLRQAAQSLKPVSTMQRPIVLITERTLPSSPHQDLLSKGFPLKAKTCGPGVQHTCRSQHARRGTRRGTPRRRPQQKSRNAKTKTRRGTPRRRHVEERQDEDVEERQDEDLHARRAAQVQEPGAAHRV